MIVTFTFAAVVGVLFAFNSRLQIATLWAGRSIAPSGSENLMPTGVQDGITPPWQTNLSLIWMVGLAGLLIGGSIQHWYLGVLAVVTALVVSTVVGSLFPHDFATYLRLIAGSLARREADYRRAGDTARAEAAHEFFLKVSSLVERAASTKQRLPTMREAQAAPFGQLEPV
jgi:hypothetical protein